MNETVALLAARSPKLRQAVRAAQKAGYAYVVLDGTLIPVDRVAADRPFYSGKHKKHGMNLQVIASPRGDILWVSGRGPDRCTIRRPSGPGAFWTTWRPPAWSLWRTTGSFVRGATEGGWRALLRRQYRARQVLHAHHEEHEPIDSRLGDLRGL